MEAVSVRSVETETEMVSSCGGGGCNIDWGYGVGFWYGVMKCGCLNTAMQHSCGGAFVPFAHLVGSTGPHVRRMLSLEPGLGMSVALGLRLALGTRTRLRIRFRFWVGFRRGAIWA